MRTLPGLLTILLLAGCSDSSPAPQPDAADARASETAPGDGAQPDQPPAADSGDDGASPDGPAADSGPTPQNEVEPNDGKQTSEVNAISVPAIVNGAIGSANDADVFAITGAAGQRLTVTVTPGGGSSLRAAGAGASNSAAHAPPGRPANPRQASAAIAAM